MRPKSNLNVIVDAVFCCIASLALERMTHCRSTQDAGKMPTSKTISLSVSSVVPYPPKNATNTQTVSELKD